MKWIAFPYSESYFEETKYILVKFYQFSCIQEYSLTNSIRKRVWIVYTFSAFLYANVPAEFPSYAPTFFVNLYHIDMILFFILKNRIVKLIVVSISINLLYLVSFTKIKFAGFDVSGKKKNSFRTKFQM